MSASIFDGVLVKIQKGILKLLNGAEIHTGTVDPTDVAVSAPKGSLYLNTDTAKVYRKADNGLSKVWIDISVATLAPANEILSARIPSYTNTTQAYTDAATVTLTTTGRTVELKLVSDPTSLSYAAVTAQQSAGSGCKYKWLRNGTKIAEGIFYSSEQQGSPQPTDFHTMGIPMGAVSHTDYQAPVGSNIYKLQLAALGVNDDITFESFKLYARET